MSCSSERIFHRIGTQKYELKSDVEFIITVFLLSIVAKGMLEKSCGCYIHLWSCAIC